MQAYRAQGELGGRNAMVAVLSSWGFLVGSAALVLAFALELARQNGVLPAGQVSDAATLYVQATLTPASLFVFGIAGLLAPPAPFRTGLLLGMVAAALITLLVALVPQATLESYGGTGGLQTMWLTAAALGALATGTAAWFVNSLIRRRVVGDGSSAAFEGTAIAQRQPPTSVEQGGAAAPGWPGSESEQVRQPTPSALDASRQSPGYRSAGSRAKAAQVALGLSALVAWSMAAATADILDEVLAGTLTNRRIDAWLLLMDNYVYLLLIVTIASTIAFLAWLSRSVDNVPALQGGIPRWSPRWAIVWWLVPIANLFMPLVVVRDLARRIGELDAEKNTSTLVGLWWTLFLVGGLGNRVVTSMSPVDVGVGGTRFVVIVLTQVAGAVAAVLGIMVVRRLQDAAADRAEQQG